MVLPKGREMASCILWNSLRLMTLTIPLVGMQRGHFLTGILAKSVKYQRWRQLTGQRASCSGDLEPRFQACRCRLGVSLAPAYRNWRFWYAQLGPTACFGRTLSENCNVDTTQRGLRAYRAAAWAFLSMHRGARVVHGGACWELEGARIPLRRLAVPKF
jgi:hypothetical protein